MFKHILYCCVLIIACHSENKPDHFGFGRAATQQEIAAVPAAIPPDGTGLPPGQGTVSEGSVCYAAKCASCHGNTGTEGPFNVLVAPDTANAIPFDQTVFRVKAIGNYWPYATTVFDYIRRAMPFNAPGSLTDQEVYSITAWLLYRNQLINENFVINAHTLPTVVMPARSKYVVSDN
ncbi:cytochrome c [Chitinophaga sp.]|uniref:c-type cytochrome n=1 Tax=Chitinophaga sp. TaxID=1869181 RepID=UPI0031E22319